MRVKKTTLSLRSLAILRDLIIDTEFIVRHKVGITNFIRKRKLPFDRVLLFLLKKSVKSLTCWLNEVESITSSAFSQARRKFRHTAFVELLQKSVVEVVYSADHETYKSHRLLALDGMRVNLPDTEETRKEFGFVPALNRWRSTGNVEGKAAVIYDVLNEIPLASTIVKGRTSDLKACQEILSSLNPNDIIVADRGYCSYEFFSQIIARNVHFVIRCPVDRYKNIHKMQLRGAPREKIVELPRPGYKQSDSGSPNELRLRFIAINLPSGEKEILITTLTDTKKYPYNDFRKIYHRRWHIETFFSVLKSRLNLENFTGKSVECIKQDFYATVYISGLESLLTADAQSELDDKETVYPQRVNKAISFNIIKNRMFQILEEPPKDFLKEVTALFLLNPTLVRQNREKPPRKHGSAAMQRKVAFYRGARKYSY